MIRLFRFVGLVEGITTLALFCVAMPLKYFWAMPAFVPPVGMIHGLAFVFYLIAMGVCLWGRGLTRRQWARTTLAAFVPFGTFLNDPMLHRLQLADEAKIA